MVALKHLNEAGVALDALIKGRPSERPRWCMTGA